MLDRTQQPRRSVSQEPPSAADQHLRERLAYDRLILAITKQETVDSLAQAFCVVCAETFSGLASITLLNQHNELMHIAGVHDTEPAALSLLRDVIVAAADMPRDQGLGAQVILTGQPVLMDSVPEDLLRSVVLPEFVRYVEQVGIGSLMVVPLSGRSGVFGAVSVSRHAGHRALTYSDLELLQAMALRMSIGIEQLILVESLRREIADASSAKMALSISEGRFRSIFESTALGIEIVDPVGVIVDVNAAFESMTGFSRYELLGRHFGTLQHPDHIAPVQRAFTEAQFNRGDDAPIEGRILRKDGTILWIKTHLAAVKRAPDDELPAFIVAMHENVTGRKQAEQYFQAVLEATPDALVMVSDDGRVILVNRQAEKLFGFSRTQMLSMRIEDLIPERFRGAHPTYRIEYLGDPHIRPMGRAAELWALARDGREIPVEISLSPLRTDTGMVTVAAIRDITERKQRQAALIQSERTLAEAQRVARLGSVEFEIATGKVEISEEGLRIMGLERQEVDGSAAFMSVVHPDDRERIQEKSRATITSGEPEEFEFRVLRPDGTERILHDRVVPYFAPDGRPVRLLGTIQDVTEQRTAEREMEELKNHLQSSVELERLHLAQDLHDGPMQDLYGASYRLDELQRKAEDPLIRQVLQDVNQQLQVTVSDLRDIARELRPPALSNFGLEKAIRSYVQDFSAKHPDIKLHVSLAHDRQMLPETVRLTLFRVLQQALANVLRHSHATEVQVRFTLDAEEARLAVRDNGKGFEVPPNWMSFVRNGHYGLAGAAERVHALGGLLLVESQPGASTVVTAMIPWTPT